VESSLERGEEPRPVMNIAPLVRPMLVDLLYAACPDIDTVFVIRTDRNWVADSFGLKGQPTHLVMDPDPSRRRLYILAPREAAIKAVDLSSQRIIDSIHIPMTDTPTFMTISPDAKWAYVLDERASYLNQIDLATGRSAARVRVPYRPQYAAYLADQNVLAVSAGLSQVVTLHNPTNLTEVGTIRTGSSPEGLLAAAGQLYVAERGDHTVTLFNLAANRAQGRLDVGFGPRRLLFDGHQIYVSNYDDGSLAVLIPEQLGVIREIHGLGRPLEMAFDETYRKIYVGDEQAGALAVIDSTSNQFLGYIHLGARPLGLAVLP
jgi:DNA-binding beta-propeller fold protein YncE